MFNPTLISLIGSGIVLVIGMVIIGCSMLSSVSGDTSNMLIGFGLGFVGLGLAGIVFTGVNVATDSSSAPASTQPTSLPFEEHKARVLNGFYDRPYNQ